MRAVTYVDELATVGEAYGKAFVEAGLPEDRDRGSVELGRLVATEMDPVLLFGYAGNGDLDKGLKESATALVKALSYLSSPMSVDLAKGNAFRARCCEAAGRVLFAADWARAMEDADRADELSGRNVGDIAPPTPNAYLEAGRFLIGLVEGVNADVVGSLYAKALAAHFPDPVDRAAAQDSPRFGVVRFAECLALEATGTGVAWTDDATPFEIEMPTLEIAMSPIEIEERTTPTP